MKNSGIQRLLRRFRLVGLIFCASILASSACAPGDGDGPPERQCLDTCESLGRQCGEVCGTACGVCGEGSEGETLSCVGGLCRCVPSCDPGSCGGSNGCGGICPCPEDVSCEDCGLRLVRAELAGDSQVLDRVAVAVEWNGALDAELPKMADIRLDVPENLVLERVQIHEPLIDARKLLHRFTGSNKAWRKLEDGSLQVLIFPGSRNEVIRPGRWLTLHFSNPDRVEGEQAFGLIFHDQMLAPLAADALAKVDGGQRPLVLRPGGADQ